MIDVVLQERLVGNVSNAAFFVCGRYTLCHFTAILHAGRRRTSISSHELTERKMIATAQRKHDNRVHLNAEFRNDVHDKLAPCKSYAAVTHVHLLNWK